MNPEGGLKPRIRSVRPDTLQSSQMKFGKIKREHSRVGGLDRLLERVLAECPGVTRIVPGRITRRRGKTPPSFKIQYDTPTGLKCLFNGTGTVQEVFIVTTDASATKAWIESTDLV